MPTLEKRQFRPNTAPASPVPPPVPRAHRIAFLLSRYPAISHTFLLNEILGLRARGFHIEAASINSPDRPVEHLPTLEAAESRSTFYIKRTHWHDALSAIVTTAVDHPKVLLRGLTAILRLRGLTLRMRILWLFYLAEAILLGRWLRARKLKHIHVHFGGPVASVGMLASIAWQIPYSLTIHGPEELLDADLYQLREKITQASFVFCISDFCRSQLCQLTPPGHWSKFEVVRLGVDPVLLTPPAHSGHRDHATLSLVCTGRLVAVKGHHILLEALRELRDRGIDLRTTLIGDGPERAALEAFVFAHKLEDAVTFTSALSHAKTLQHVRTADLFVLASFAEGIPVALMEAMAFAVPCISTTIAGIPELITSGETGILVPPANVTALADAIESLVTDPALRKYLGATGRQRIIRDYNLPLNHERLAQSFHERLMALEPRP